MKLEENLQSLILNELKCMGVNVPKSKKRIAHCKKNQSSCYESCSYKIFGVPLASQEWITVDCHSTPVPSFLAIATEYLLQHKQSEGLFRKTGSITRQRELKKCIENGGNFEGSTPHDVTSLLKQWFRELPEPVIPRSLHDIFLGCYQVEENCVNTCLLACLLLPTEHLYTLKHTVNFLSHIAKHSSENKMNSFNLAVIMAPNLLPASKQCNEKTRLQNCHPDNWKRRSRNSPAIDTLDLRSLVEYQTGLIHLLIENEDKVGHFPSDIAEKFGSLGMIIQEEGENEKSLDVLEKSDELTDGPPKAKKKRRSGTVQELVSGIRKFVSQKRTPLQSLPVTSDACSPIKFLGQDRPNSPTCRSACKRKADCKASLSVDKKALCHEMSLDSNFVNTPETKGELHLTSVLSPCAIVSLSDIDCDSPAERKYNPSPMARTHRKSLRIIKNQKRRNTTTRSIKNTKLHIKDTGKPNPITEVDAHSNEAITDNINDSKDLNKSNSPDITVHMVRQVALLSLLSPNQTNSLSDNDATSHQQVYLDKSQINTSEQKENKVNGGKISLTMTNVNKIQDNDKLENFPSRKSSMQTYSENNVLQEIEKISNEDKLDTNKIHKQQNNRITTNKENLVRKVGSTRNGKCTSKTKLERHTSSRSVIDAGTTITTNSTIKPRRKRSSRSRTQKEIPVCAATNRKNKMERKNSLNSFACNKAPIIADTEIKINLSRKTSSSSVKDEHFIAATNAKYKTKLEKNFSSPSIITKETSVITSKEKVRPRSKSSLRRGRPNTITSGLPPIYGKYYSDSIVYVDGKSHSLTDNPQTSENIITQTSGNIITRSKSISNNNLNGEELTISNTVFSPKMNETRSKVKITLEDLLIDKSSNSSFEGLNLAERKAICSISLDNDCIRKSLFVEQDSDNDSLSDQLKKFSDSVEQEYSVSGKQTCEVDNKASEQNDALVEIKNSINVSMMKANNKHISDACLHLNQHQNCNCFADKTILQGSSSFQDEDKMQKCENEKEEITPHLDKHLNDILSTDKLDQSDSMDQNFLVNLIPGTPKDLLLLTENNKELIEMSKSYEESQWTCASEYLSKQETEVCDYTKRESIMKLRIRNAGVVKANVLHYNSIGGNGSFCTPEICRTRKSQSPTSVCNPSTFTRNSVGTQSLCTKSSSVGRKNNANSKLTYSAPKLSNNSEINNEFKMPTPLRKTRKQIQIQSKENMCLRSSERI